MNQKNRQILLLILSPLLIPVILIGFFGGMRIHQNCQREAYRKQLWEESYQKSMAERKAHEKDTPRPTSEPIRPEALAIPVIGMKECDINRTKHPKSFRKTTESTVNGRHYVYYSDANAVKDIPCTVSLKCTDGIVTEVNDYRDDPKEIIHSKPKNTASTGAKPYDPYGDAEEFYYQNEDEFADFDEAEEYYLAHYGK